jgi:protein HOOK3
VNKNAALEEEYRKVAAFKPLMESYKNQIADLEAKNSSRNQDIESLKFELDQTRTKLKISQEERAKDAESLELYQERVKELELSSSHRSSAQGGPRSVGLSRLNSSASENFPAVTPTSPNMETDDEVHGLGEELDDAIAGRTTTDLKLQIKKLQRELDAHKKNEADTSRLLVLENLLEDANRTKARYESDYLTAHREKLMLQRDLDEIRSGKSLGDG